MKAESPISEMRLESLDAGGVITNYHCTARCAHCLYNCGPEREISYLSERDAESIFSLIRSFGCRSVHVGGGEPLLNLKGLKKVLAAADRAGVGLDYVETNCSWYVDEKTTLRIFSELADHGLRTLLVSISPFHNESIALVKVRGVLASCRKAGIDVFPWSGYFLNELSSLDESRPHSLDEMMDYFGPHYLGDVRRRYWMHPGGRALTVLRALSQTYPAEEIVGQNPESCRRDLADASHFHIDLYRTYIPGLCSGIAFPSGLLGTTLDKNRFRVLSVLWTEGVGGLYGWARKEYGFTPRRDGYSSKCDLCNNIRGYLAETGNVFEELQPPGYYG